MRRFFFGLGVAAFAALGVVQQQVALIQLGYQVESFRHRREELLDQHRVLQYNVLTLRSPVILNQRLARRDVRLSSPAAVEVLSSHAEPSPTTQPWKEVGKPEPSWWQGAVRLASHWLGGGRQAEAEPALGEGNHLSAGM